jgi:hypothetical protein
MKFVKPNPARDGDPTGDKTMNTATEIAREAKDATDAIRRAEAQNSDVSQDWEDEATIYEFADASVLVVSGSAWKSYHDFPSVKTDFPNC